MKSTTVKTPVSQNQRLNPNWTHDRYYGLIGLREALKEAIERYVKPLTTRRASPVALDLGCGTIPYQSLLEPYVAVYLGADIEGNPRADLEVNAKTGRVNRESDSVDVVISTQVLEHVESPAAYLDEAYRLCKPGGLLLLSTHGFWLYHPDPVDYWRWTGAGLCKLLEDHGWKVVHRVGILGFAAAALSLLQDSTSPKLPRMFRPAFAFASQRIIGLVDRFYTPEGRQENAVLYLVVAERPAGPE